MGTVRVQGAKRQRAPVAALPIPVPLAEGSVTLAMIEALIPLGLRAVEDALPEEVRAPPRSTRRSPPASALSRDPAAPRTPHSAGFRPRPPTRSVVDAAPARPDIRTGAKEFPVQLQSYFTVSPPTIHQMVLTLHARGLSTREPGRPRSIRLLLGQAELPDLEWEGTPGSERSQGSVARSQTGAGSPGPWQGPERPSPSPPSDFCLLSSVFCLLSSDP